MPDRVRRGGECDEDPGDAVPLLAGERLGRLGWLAGERLGWLAGERLGWLAGERLGRLAGHDPAGGGEEADPVAGDGRLITVGREPPPRSRLLTG